jgi:hypothetical protein
MAPRIHCRITRCCLLPWLWPLSCTVIILAAASSRGYGRSRALSSYSLLPPPVAMAALVHCHHTRCCLLPWLWPLFFTVTVLAAASSRRYGRSRALSSYSLLPPPVAMAALVHYRITRCCLLPSPCPLSCTVNILAAASSCGYGPSRALSHYSLLPPPVAMAALVHFHSTRYCLLPSLWPLSLTVTLLAAVSSRRYGRSRALSYYSDYSLLPPSVAMAALVHYRINVM